MSEIVVTGYRFLDADTSDGITLGGGTRYVGSVKTYDRSSTATPALGSYALFDASVGYTLDRWHLQLNVKNVAAS